MREFKDVPYVRKQRSKTICDICGAEALFDNWSAELFGSDATTIEHASGDKYPEGDFGETVSYDICPTCFTDKIEPFLQSLGAKPTNTEWE